MLGLPEYAPAPREILDDCAQFTVGLLECFAYFILFFVLMPLGVALLICTPPGWIYLRKVWKRMKKEEEEVDEG